MVARTWYGSIVLDPSEVTKENLEPSIFLGFTIYDRQIPPDPRGFEFDDPLGCAAASVQMDAWFAGRDKLPAPDEAARLGAEILADYDKWKAKLPNTPQFPVRAREYANHAINIDRTAARYGANFEIYFAFALVDRAVELLRAGNRELAAMHLIQAAQLLPNTIVRRPHSLLASAGGRARDKAFEPLRAIAREMAKAGNFPSRRNAALSIAPKIIEIAPQYGLRLSAQQAERTITKWLTDIPFAGKRSDSFQHALNSRQHSFLTPYRSHLIVRPSSRKQRSAMTMQNIYRLPAVKARTGLSRSTIYLRMAAGTFPKAISLGDRAVGWLDSEIAEWIAQRVEQSRAKAER